MEGIIFFFKKKEKGRVYIRFELNKDIRKRQGGVRVFAWAQECDNQINQSISSEI